MMAATILVIRRDADRDAFATRLSAADLTWQAVEGLPRHFIIPGVAPADFPMKDDAAILAVEDGSESAEPPGAFVLAGDMSGGNWGLARHVRRDAPWNVDRINHPLPTYFRSLRDGTGVDIYAVEGDTRTGHQEFGGRVSAIHSPTDTAGVPEHGTAAFSIALGASTGFAPGALGFLAGWGANASAAWVQACGAILSHYNGRSATNRPAVCWVAVQATSFFTTFEEAVADLIDAGIVVVSVAGNFGDDMAVSPRYPGTFADVICVGGVFANDTPALMGSLPTGYGSRVDVSAAGRAVHAASHVADDEYIRFSGTSASAPAVAGVVACMLQGHSRLTTRAQVQAVRAKLIANATTGRLRDQTQFGLPAGGLPDRILYLDPDQTAPEPIDGL